MSKYLPYEQAEAIYDKILSIDLDKIQVVTTRRIYHKDFAQQLRELLRSLGINSRMVSVTAPNYSMAVAIDVKVPQIAAEMTYKEREALSPEEYAKSEQKHIQQEEYRYKATKHMRDIILKAFPGCDDRSDVMIDYFDSMFYCY